VPPTPAQVSHVQEANRNPALFAHANGGHPAIAATARPAAFSGPGVISAHGAAPIANQPGRAGALPPANNSNNLGAQAAAARQLQTNGAQGAPRGQAPAAPAAQQKAYVGKPQVQLAKPPAAPPPKTGTPNNGKPASPPHPEKEHEGERDK